MIPLLLQMPPRPSLTVFKANDSLLNDNKREVASHRNSSLFANALKYTCSNFLFSLRCHPQIWLRLVDHQMTS